MKKAYETPSVEVVMFQYKDQVVAQSGCTTQKTHVGDTSCKSQGADCGETFYHN